MTILETLISALESAGRMSWISFANLLMSLVPS